MTARIAVWWRDDDAVKDSLALQRLLELRRRWNVPLSLAVIPAAADGSLSSVAASHDVDVLVHGFAHVDCASPGDRKAEFTEHRDGAEMREELSAGLDRLRRFLPETLPVFVPPWNRFPQSLLPLLAETYSGLSAWGRETEWPVPECLTVANMHLDIVDWRQGGQAKPLDALIAEYEALVASGRHGQQAPVGILSHHLQMTDDAFANLDGIFRYLSARPDVVWTRARSIFRMTERRT